MLLKQIIILPDAVAFWYQSTPNKLFPNYRLELCSLFNSNAFFLVMQNNSPNSFGLQSKFLTKAKYTLISSENHELSYQKTSALQSYSEEPNVMFHKLSKYNSISPIYFISFSLKMFHQFIFSPNL